MLQRLLMLAAGILLFSDSGEAAEGCERMEAGGARYTVCRFEVPDPRLRFHLNGRDGSAFGGFSALERALESEGKSLVFAMNGGMYHSDLSPVGLYIENGETLKLANIKPGPGNFHMLPNGVFWLHGGEAGVTETRAFLNSGRQPDYATQSGPMLVIDGQLHPRFFPESRSYKIRNGVGLCNDGRTLAFAITNGAVNFWSFAAFFRDDLGCPNALYLDGTISSLHAPSLGRSDRLFPMGPMIAVID